VHIPYFAKTIACSSIRRPRQAIARPIVPVSRHAEEASKGIPVTRETDRTHVRCPVRSRTDWPGTRATTSLGLETAAGQQHDPVVLSKTEGESSGERSSFFFFLGIRRRSCPMFCAPRIRSRSSVVRFTSVFGENSIPRASIMARARRGRSPCMPYDTACSSH